VLRENKKQEVIQKIVNDSAIDRERKMISEKAVKVIAAGKRFSLMTKQLELIAEQRRQKKEMKKKQGGGRFSRKRQSDRSERLSGVHVNPQKARNE